MFYVTDSDSKYSYIQALRLLASLCPENSSVLRRSQTHNVTDNRKRTTFTPEILTNNKFYCFPLFTLYLKLLTPSVSNYNEHQCETVEFVGLPIAR